MPVKNSVKNVKIRAMPWLPNMQQLKLLSLCWRSFSGFDREHVTVVFPSQGCKYQLNGCVQPIGTEIIQDAKLTIVDALLILILRMGRWPCWPFFCLSMLPIYWLHIRATKSLCKYRTYKTTNHWLSIEAQSQIGAVTLLPSLLLTKSANPSVMHKSHRITE